MGRKPFFHYEEPDLEALRARRYGLEARDLAILRVQQRDRCKICGKRAKRKLAIDHDHQTGKVRGLLCKKCNLGLGMFDDDPELLIQAAIYLESSQD